MERCKELMKKNRELAEHMIARKQVISCLAMAKLN